MNNKSKEGKGLSLLINTLTINNIYMSLQVYFINWYSTYQHQQQYLRLTSLRLQGKCHVVN